MKNNIENVPAEIFDWMSSVRFKALSADRKRNVLKYFTEDEYNELFDSNFKIRNALQTKESFQAIKANLMQHFDEKYPLPNNHLRLNATMMWKVASVLFLVSTLWFAFKKSTENIVANPLIITKKDTLYIEREAVVANGKPDTIFAEKTIERVKTVRPNMMPKYNESNEKIASSGGEEREFALVPKASNDFQILPVASMNNISNTTKRNSMQDDTLEKNFKFVSM